MFRTRWTDYKVEMRTNVPVFKVKDASVRRRYSDFKVRRDLFWILSVRYSPGIYGNFF